MKQILEAVFNDPEWDMIILDRVIPRKTYPLTEEKDPTRAVIDYLRKNRSRKSLVAVIDGSG